MAEDQKTGTESYDNVPDSSKGAVIPDGRGGVTLDAPTENRDAIPSPVENRDAVRNEDDAIGSADTKGAQVTNPEVLLRAGWQVGNFDAGTGAGGDVLANLAFPSAEAVRAERRPVNPNAETLIGGAENNGLADPVTEANDGREDTAGITPESDRVDIHDASRVDGDGEQKSDVLVEGSTSDNSVLGDPTPPLGDPVPTAPSDVNGDGKVDSWEGVPEADLTPQQKRARTLAANKAKEQEEKEAAAKAAGTSS